MMMRDLLRYHDKRGGFPEDLQKLEGVIWERKNRLFSAENRALHHRNYYYFYTRISPHQLTLWAIPTGSSREDSPTWFLVVSPDNCRRFKGAALPLEQVDRIEANPTLKQLGVFGAIFLAVKLGLSPKPEGASWRQLYGLSILCGIGFTMSLFIGGLAFSTMEMQAQIRLGVLGGSIVSAVIGYMLLACCGKKQQKPA